MTHIERMINLKIKEDYLKQTEKIEVKLLPVDGLCRGYIDNFSFKKDQLYKIIFTEEIPDTESFTLVFTETIGCRNPQPSTYENNKYSCFVRFKKDWTVGIHFYKGVQQFHLSHVE